MQCSNAWTTNPFPAIHKDKKGLGGDIFWELQMFVKIVCMQGIKLSCKVAHLIDMHTCHGLCEFAVLGQEF
jgi:hypothetical protein